MEKTKGGWALILIDNITGQRQKFIAKILPIKGQFFSYVCLFFKFSPKLMMATRTFELTNNIP